MSPNIIFALPILGIIIVIHELGHFLVAKYFKIRVETFSVGFGPRLIGFRRGETDYRISAIPLGGYVKMSGENPADNPTGAADEFMSKPKWQRFLVAAAGPAMNVILAVSLVLGLFMYGAEMPEELEGAAVVGGVEAGSAAEAAGIQPGDRIVMLDGKKEPNWQDVTVRIVTSPERSLPMIVERDGRQVETTIRPVRKGHAEMGYVGMGARARDVIGGLQDGRPAQRSGLQIGDEIISANAIDLQSEGRSIQDALQTIPDRTFPMTVSRKGSIVEVTVTPIITILENTPAYKAGLRDGDQIVSINGVALATMDRSLRSVFQEVAGKSFTVTAIRDGATRDFTVDAAGTDVRAIGIVRILGISDLRPKMITIKLGMADAFRRSIAINIENGALIFQVLGKLFTREVSINALDGPLGIVKESGRAISAGLTPTILFTALISLNLGVLNTLPIPILDGGVMMLLLVEGLIRRDLSLRVKEVIVQVSFVFLLMFTAFVIYNDVVKLGHPGP